MSWVKRADKKWYFTTNTLLLQKLWRRNQFFKVIQLLVKGFVLYIFIHYSPDKKFFLVLVSTRDGVFALLV